ncbi:D-sedoheptulose 7-phosphate isomerase [Saccharicrinis sp. FJH54]|uniref:D-sedoheptulose 7-phosphate isomerase n=1 Tax=Saccharicrinis sp. FJH54 TaxID=3344665 RepID=UPI0035D427DF
MSIEIIRNNFVEAQKVLNEFISEPKNFETILNAGNLIADAIRNGNKILSCGNGGSMCDSMHFAEEMTGRFRRNRKALPAFAMADASHITCSANDYGYEAVFSRYVEAFGAEGDVLLALSTSGNSPNIVNAANVAKNRGMKIIGLTGKGGGILAGICDVEIRVDHLGWSDRIQEIHIKIIHTLIDYVETELGVGQE